MKRDMNSNVTDLYIVKKTVSVANCSIFQQYASCHIADQSRKLKCLGSKSGVYKCHGLLFLWPIA